MHDRRRCGRTTARHPRPSASSASPAPIGGCWFAARCCWRSRSASTGSGSPPTCAASCGRTPRSPARTLEYTGTATELLIGFLIAIAILVPLNLMLFVAALSLGPVGQFAGMLSFPLLFLLGQFAVYRARRYRLTRTIYRGVRCHQNGSALRYAICASFWWIADRAHARPRLSVRAGAARTLQDAAHLLRQSSGPLRGLGLAAVLARLC